MKSGKKDILYYLGLGSSYLSVIILLLLNTGFVNLNPNLGKENKTEEKDKQDTSEEKQTILKETSLKALVPLADINFHPNLPFISSFDFPQIQKAVSIYEQSDTLSPYFEVVLQFIISINAP